MVNYCCTHVLLYARMLKETETKKTIIVFFVTFLSLVAFIFETNCLLPCCNFNLGKNDVVNLR